MQSKGRKWMSEGIVFMFNSMSLGRDIRAGVLGTDGWERYEREHSEEAVVAMKAAGVNFVITHFHWGYGLAAEKPEMEWTKRFTELCHKHGIKVGAYLRSIDAMMYETWQREYPEARQWASVDQNGQIPRYTWSLAYNQWAPCINQEGFLAAIEKIISHAVKYVRADLIHFDNFLLWNAPFSCHCQTCQEKFREYLKQKYPDDSIRMRRFGITILDHVEPPVFAMPFGGPWSLEAIVDPVHQEWIMFRCDLLSQAYARFSRYIRGLNPDVAVELNTWTGGNSAYAYASWPPDLVTHGEFHWTEERNHAQVIDEDVVVSKIRGFKVGRATGNTVFTYTAGAKRKHSPEDVGNSDSRLLMAECMAYNPGTIGMVGNFSMPVVDHCDQPYIDFYRRHQEIFCDTESLANVAVLRSFSSSTFNNYATHLSRTLFEQTLIQAQVPFDVVFDDWLGEPTHAILVLANVESLSDDQLGAIRRFVDSGGGLVATDQTSLYDQWRRQRPSFGLADLFGLDSGDGESDRTHKKTYGKGRVAYISQIVPTVAPQRPNESLEYGSIWRSLGPGQIHHRYWKLPQNWQKLMDAVHWVCPSLPVEVEAPPTVTVEFLCQRERERQLLHLVNFDWQNSVSNIRVTMRVPPNQAVRNLTLLSPEQEGAQELQFTVCDDGITFAIANLEIYGIAVAELGRA